MMLRRANRRRHLAFGYWSPGGGRHALVFVVALVVGLAPSSGRAEEGGRDAHVIARRGDLTLGTGGGLFVASYRERSDRNSPPTGSLAAAGPAAGTGGSFWIGAAMTDWLTFAVGLSGGGVGSEPQGEGGGFVVRLEAFPAFQLGGIFRDLGLFTELGGGGAAIRDSEEELANGRFMSFVSVGAFWETWKFWLLSTGPSVQYTHMSSPSMDVHSATIGMRLAFYSSQVTEASATGSTESRHL